MNSISNHQQNYNNNSNFSKNKPKLSNNPPDTSAYASQLSITQKPSYISALEPHSEVPVVGNPKKRMTVIHEQNSDGDHDYNQT